MRYILFLFLYFFVMPCYGKEYNIDHTFDIPTDEKIPLIWRLQKEYKQETSLYDWHYGFSWNMPKVFDTDFEKNIETFGSVEKRITNEDEEGLYNDIKRMPEEFYPYVGPMLHTIRGLSGKILDMPGIKETKNRFPTRIAKRFQNIPDIEFASPELYIFLMPEIFGEGYSVKEWQNLNKKKPKQLKVKINPEFITEITAKVRPENYVSGAELKSNLPSQRHYVINAKTPLSTADVRDFLATFKGLQDFKSKDNNEINFMSMIPLMTYWDVKNGDNKDVAFLKNVVNPCQSLVRKAKWLGVRESFQDAVIEQGFSLDDWGYTCDKVLKALRVSTLTTSDITSLRILKSGLVYKMLRGMNYTAPEREQQRYFLNAAAQLYEAPAENIDAVQPYKDELLKSFYSMGKFFMGTPFVLP